MKLSELISADPIETDRKIKRALNFTPENLNVDGDEALLVDCLLNYTAKNAERSYLTDRGSARKIARNSEHMLECANQLKFYHTHNLKFPDARVSKQRIIAAKPGPNPYLLSSAHLPIRLGWSYDAKHINRARFFLTEFSWKNKTTTLVKCLNEETDFWSGILNQAGITKNTISKFKKILSSKPLSDDFPEKINGYSPQLRFPYKGFDLSITPVMSHAVSLKISQLIRQKRLQYFEFEYDRPSSISCLLSSSAGFHRLLEQLPLVHKKYSDFDTSRLSKASKNTLLDDFHVNSWKFIDLLKGIISSDINAEDKERKKTYSEIQCYLTRWLNPIIEWRRHYLSDSNSLDGVVVEQNVYDLISTSNLDDERLTKDLFSTLTRILSNNRKGRFIAYNPKLIKPLKGCLRRVIKTFDDECHVVEQNNELFLHLENIRITRCKLNANPYAAGIPSITALYGFMKRLSINLKDIFSLDLDFKRVAFFIRSFDISRSSVLPEKQYYKDRKSVKTPLIIPNIYGDLEIDLFIHISSSFEEDQLTQLTTCVKAALPDHFASGSIHPQPINKQEEFAKIKSGKMLFDEVSRFPSSGCWIIPTSESIDNFDHMIELLENNKRLRLANAGYTLLEEPTARDGSDEKMHAYAEPNLGLIECVNAIDFRRLGGKDFFRKAFWSLYSEKNAILMHKSRWEYKNNKKMKNF